MVKAPLILVLYPPKSWGVIKNSIFQKSTVPNHQLGVYYLSIVRRLLLMANALMVNSYYTYGH